MHSAHLNTVRDINYTVYQAALPWQLHGKIPLLPPFRKKQSKKQEWKEENGQPAEICNCPEKIKQY